MLYGCKCLGMPNAQLRKLRRSAGKVLPGSKGAKSLTLQLAIASEEPAYDVTEAPVLRWARAAREATGPKVQDETFAASLNARVPTPRQVRIAPTLPSGSRE